jgi:hypothetical protein
LVQEVASKWLNRATVGPVNIQTSASDFWGKQIHQTWARIPKKYLKHEYVEVQGLDVEFDCLLAVRQAHGFAFGKSDLFMLCGARLAAETRKSGTQRPKLVPCGKVRV